jgi:hypothetical protein
MESDQGTSEVSTEQKSTEPVAPPTMEPANSQDDPMRVPGVEEQRRSDELSWERWKGSVADVAKIFRLADELVEKAAGEAGEDFIARFTLDLRGRERTYRELNDLIAEAEDLDLADIQGFHMTTGYWTDKVNISIYIRRDFGAQASVSGKDSFAVAGVEGELKTALDRGRRWTQVGGRWPATLAFWAPWTAILGLALIALLDSGPWRDIGIGFLALSGCMLGIFLFMRNVEPRLVPRLELLSDTQPSTVSQVWKRRALRGLGFVVVGVAGAAINGLTGFLF